MKKKLAIGAGGDGGVEFVARSSARGSSSLPKGSKELIECQTYGSTLGRLLSWLDNAPQVAKWQS